MKNEKQTKKKISETQQNKIWINNGLVEFKIDKFQQIPNTFQEGRLKCSRSTSK